MDVADEDIVVVMGEAGDGTVAVAIVERGNSGS